MRPPRLTRVTITRCPTTPEEDRRLLAALDNLLEAFAQDQVIRLRSEQAAVQAPSIATDPTSAPNT